jgi:Ca2+-binding RTX toxin-like protein
LSITVTPSTTGGADTANGGDGADIIIGGDAGDVLGGGIGGDLIFGDYGAINRALAANINFTSTFTQSPLGGNDAIGGDAGDDTAIGGQGADQISGGDDNDDLIGGHNIAGGFDGADAIDGDAGNDAIAGDNASIVRRLDNQSRNTRTLAGATLYTAAGAANVTAGFQVDPHGVPGRDITLFDHTAATAPGVFGDDNLAGGAGHDSVFGQLGNDRMQGDGATSLNVSATQASASGAGDGDDYMEGNGGADLMFGNLGQDDLIGGSSSLFGLATPAMRPDGSDIIYGGSGGDVLRNTLGDTTPGGHARDADFILGDNGNLFRIVDAAGNFRTFTYDNYAGGVRIIPRVVQHLDYTFGGNAATDIGAADLIHGEGGDDDIYGTVGNDVLFGEGQDDDIFGGIGHDRIYAGSGEDGVIGDDGLIFTSRNGLTETLHGITAVNALTNVTVPGLKTGAYLFITGRLNKSVQLLAYDVGGNDVIYGGLGDDFLHAGAGNDAVSGAEALASFYNDAPVTNTTPIVYDPATRKLAGYDANKPLVKINNFLLNFDATVGGVKIDDGKDRIFGDLGHDWIVGGTGKDRLFGGQGDDMIDADDNKDTAGGLNSEPDAPLFADADFVYGGDGLDVMIANTGADRLYDWGGEFNTYVVPYNPFGLPTVLRKPQPALIDFLLALGAESGADRTRTEPNGELGLFREQDPQWNANHGGPRDPQGPNSKAKQDTDGGPEDDRNTALPL